MASTLRTIHLVRHAKAGNRARWNGDDSERPLTEAGRHQSRALAERLSGSVAGRLYSSTYVRCRQTLEPLAALLGAEIELVDWLTEGSGGHRLFDQLPRLPDQSVLCSHGDVITELLGMFLRRGIPVDPTPSNVRKASVLEISVHGIASDDASVTAVRYIDPPDGDSLAADAEAS